MYQKITLPNGVRILSEHMPGMRTAALGIYVGTGSRYETRAESGAAHFIEHLTFRGTERRTAEELAMEMDAVGGAVNAYTTKECTCFYGRVLDSHLDRAVDVLCDMFFNARFDERDVLTERGVILEEIGMYKDTPEDLCAENLAKAIYAPSPLSMPILGRAATLNRMTGSWLLTYKRKHYRPENIVVSLAGSFGEEHLRTLSDWFGALPAGRQRDFRPGAYRPAVVTKRKAIEQNHITIAFPGSPISDPRRYTENLLSAILGGGMSSRLFQQVREKKGLCYTVYSYTSNYADTGGFGIYTALNKDTEADAVRMICREVRTLREHGVTEEELSRAREQAKASVLMSLESVQAHMSHMGRNELFLGEVPDPDEIIDRYDAVTAEEIRTLAGEYFDFSRASLSAVGRTGAEEDYLALLAE